MASNMNDEELDAVDDNEWTPPTDAELKILAARRERQDKVSKLLGEYLLKGYKMLGTTCSSCDTILMRSKQGVDYCVTCNELDSDSTKDDPAMSSSAARSQALELNAKRQKTASCADPLETYHPTQCQSAAAASSFCEVQGHPATSVLVNASSANVAAASAAVNSLPPAAAAAVARAGEVAAAYSPIAGSVVPEAAITDALAAVTDQLTWATDELKRSRNTCAESGVQLCRLIRECADAALSLQRLQAGRF